MKDELKKFPMKNFNLKEKKSLSNIFIILVSSFLLSFLFVVYLSYSKHIEYTNVLKKINGILIPKIINSSQVYQHVNSLVYSTEKINNSKTQASRRINFEAIKEEVSQIQILGNKLVKDNYFSSNNLTVIQSELNELNTLIKKRLFIERTIKQKIQLLNQLNTELLHFYEKYYYNSINNKFAINNWRIHFGEIVNLSYQALNITKLRLLRENTTRQTELFESLDLDTKSIQEGPFLELKSFNQKLEVINFAKQGLLHLHLEQVKIDGKATGHGNFVNNLIFDFAIELEHTALKYTQSVIKSSKKSQKNAKDQIELMVLYFIGIFFILIIVLYYINNTIIKRLINLNQNVQQRISGENISIEDKKNDEISHITHSINYFAQKITEQNIQLEKLSLLDGLTNVSNRRAFDIKLQSVINFMERNEYEVSLLMIDIDFFKPYNDNYGHQKGDDTLCQIAQCLKKTVKRDLDMLARYGGEEFVCILSNCNKVNANNIASKMIKAVQKLKIIHESSKASKYVTVSIGVTTVKNIKRLHSKKIIEQADMALYKAKHKGRNQVAVYDDY